MSRSIPDSCPDEASRKGGMGQFESFARVLEKTIEKRLRQEWAQKAPQSSRADTMVKAAPDYLASLLGTVERFQQASTCKADLYHRHRRPPAPRPPHILSEAQRAALLFFQESGATELRDNYSQHELKSAFRRLALRFHPDRPQGSQALFIELKKAHDSLCLVFKR